MQKTFRFHYSRATLALLLVLLSNIPFAVFAEITMQDLVKIAIQHDPWLTGNQLQEKALRAQSQGANHLPDPMLSMGLLNLPTDGFVFNQEPMSQFKVGLAQTFPRGDSLAIKQQQLSFLADQHPYQREDRKAKIQVTVSTFWLDALKAEYTIRLIKRDRVLFEQLVDIVKASYSSAQGKTRQQDVISAQLELARLDDRLTIVNNQRDLALTRLSEWLPATVHKAMSKRFTTHIPLPKAPKLTDKVEVLLQRGDNLGLLQLLTEHPTLLAIEQSVKAGNTAVKLAKQKYKPQWGVNASYAYREDDPLGQSRADFFSIGITVDVPIFGYAKQDSDVSASSLTAQAIETEKRLLQQSMLTQIHSLYQQEVAYRQREDGFLTSILPQIQEHADASLSAYTSDDGDFSEVMRARITQLNAQIDLIHIQIEKLKTRIQIMYFLNDPNNSGEY
ncbi:TolC family protein [uncultured Paraglaciecola sp.]|uniref:TolC family protein n=1 Tax=uncultured Paraglaciecola sp. TaxID=1765024 RepID=UPI0030DCDAA4|tara:strand:+ start:44461 stop:45801 length:1341 start_codon:yes stop_codon:yes gene_type:complete